ncbi:MAG TPA: glycerate kinase [Candidatus Limiplasma sp.]|nr:glycerate kinase [Candidatus Limiplasma sp.]
MRLREDCDHITARAIEAVQPDTAVRRALEGKTFADGRVILVAIGKAAWSMANAAKQTLGDRVGGGLVITKYGHARGEIPGLAIYEAGHPVPDENSFRATEAALQLTSGLSAADTVVLLISGGGSALFESPIISAAESAALTGELLACGANIVEMNTIRKRFSKVKGGRFALHCLPAKVYSIVLSDIIGDPLDMIASGPAYPDSSTVENAVRIADQYRLTLTDSMRALLRVETPKTLSNVETVITGSVRELCLAAAQAARDLGYDPLILTDSLDCIAREAGAFFAALARYHQHSERSLALIAGGETVVRVQGNGLGGRNQELALAAAQGIRGLPGTAVFSLGSDGTDGPTDAAGGYVDGDTAGLLEARGVDAYAALQNNDAYHALLAVEGLIVTGPTGTNVNDVSVLLIRR